MAAGGAGSTDRLEPPAAGRERGGVMAKLLVFLVVVFAFAALAWMLLLPLAITRQLRAQTGFDATLEQLSVNPFTGKVELRGLVITNPPTFPVREFVELRAFRMDADVLSLFSERPVFDSMTVDLANVTLVKSRDGATNAEVFQRHFDSGRGAAGPARAHPGPAPARPAKSFLVRNLTLRMDRLVVADHSLRNPRVRDFRLGIDQTYVNVTELKQLFAPAVLKNLAPVAVAASGLLPGDWGRVVGDAAKSGAELLKEAGRKVEVRVKGYFDALEESKKP